MAQDLEIHREELFQIACQVENTTLNIMRLKKQLFLIDTRYRSWSHQTRVPSELLVEFPYEIYGTNEWELKWVNNGSYNFNLCAFTQLAPVVTVVLDIDLPYKNGKVTSLYHISESFVIENKAL